MAVTSEGAGRRRTGPSWLPLAAVLVTVVLWASAFVAIRHLGHEMSPGALSLGRLLARVWCSVDLFWYAEVSLPNVAPAGRPGPAGCACWSVGSPGSGSTTSR